MTVGPRIPVTTDWPETRHHGAVNSERTEPAAPDGGSAAAREPFWRSWTVGERVIVRYRLAEATTGPGGAAEAARVLHAGAGPSLTDALGELLAIDDDGLTVRTRRGDVAVPASAITLGKRVPPPPPPRPGRGGNQAAGSDGSAAGGGPQTTRFHGW